MSDPFKQASLLQKGRGTGVEYDASEFKELNRTEWVDSSAITKCQKCSILFSLTIRKHHCRECGKVYCHSCSNFKLVINGALKRACVDCYKKTIEGDQHKVSIIQRQSISKPLVDPTMHLYEKQNSQTTLISGEEKKSQSDAQPNGCLWTECLLMTRSLDGGEPSLFSSFPSDNLLSPECLKDIISMSIPSGNSIFSYTTDFNFTFCVKNRLGWKSENNNNNGGNNTSDNNTDISERSSTSDIRHSIPSSPGVSSSIVTGGFGISKNFQTLNCFVSFHKVHNSATGKYRAQSLVLVSRYPFPTLFYRLLDKLDEAMSNNAPSGSTNPSNSSSTNIIIDGMIPLSDVYNALSVGYQQLESWPAPIANTPNYLPSFGDIMQFSIQVPANLTTGIVRSDLSTLNVGAAASFANDVNLLAQLSPFGLLPHVWSLWETLILGRDILVLSDTPVVASEMVISLSSIIAAANIDCAASYIRPFLTRDSSELRAISSQAKSKRGQNADTIEKCSSSIVGISDPTLLYDFRYFSVVIVLKNPNISLDHADESPSAAENEEPSRNASVSGTPSTSKKSFSVLGSAPAFGDGVLQSYNSKFVAQSKVLVSNETYLKSFTAWKESYKSEPDKSILVPGFLMFTIEPNPSPFKERILKTLKKLSPRDYLILGNRVLVDHLNELTQVIMKPPGITDSAPTMSSKPMTASQKSTTTSSSPAVTSSKVDNITKSAKPKTKKVIKKKMVPKQKVSSTKKRENISPWCVKVIQLIDEHPNVAMGILLIIPLFILLFVQGVINVVLLGLCLIFNVSETLHLALAEIRLQVGGDEYDRQKLEDKNSSEVSKSEPEMEEVEEIEEEIETDANADVTADRASLDTQQVIEDDASTYPRCDFSGVWKRSRTENFEAFLEGQGISYVQRRLAMSFGVTHTIAMDDPHLTTFRLQESAGPVSSDCTTIIGGDAVECLMGKNLWLDQAFWAGPNILGLKKIHLPDRDFQVIVTRYMEDGETLRMDIHLENFKTKAVVDSSSWFTKSGPTPLPRPPTATQFIRKTAGAAVAAPLQSAVEIEVPQAPVAPTAPACPTVDLSGFWTRVRTHNVDSYIGAQGGGFLQRKLATSIPMVHILTMNPPDLNCCRIQEQGGPMNSDDTYTAGQDPVTRKLLARTFDDRLFWEEGSTPTLCLVREHEAKDFQLILRRYLQESDMGGDPQLVLVATHRDLATGIETSGTSWFTKTKLSPNPPPVAQIKHKPPPASTVPPPSILRNNAPESGGSDVTKVSSEQSAKETVTKQEQQKEKNSSTSTITSSKPISYQLRVNMSGTWQRISATIGNNKLQLNAAVIIHTITMDAPYYTSVRMQESIRGGSITFDETYQIGGEPTVTKASNKSFLDKVYWEGEAFVHERAQEKGTFVLLLKRYLEVDESQNSRIRLVALKRNQKTGQETESISFFSLCGPSSLALKDFYDNSNLSSSAVVNSSPNPSSKAVVIKSASKTVKFDA